ncbi:hypothetical protein SteCoe_19266 [Stentor coeruleus]|uniref:SAM dependent carboxyl methyltransferase n=1 Tax=Stentor coeruleus TaxID=5963 RepID=A0A1R2BUH8_9CILI|nr:hypothetical protein SteCoe_19266 [Stentor coeruleus]
MAFEQHSLNGYNSGCAWQLEINLKSLDLFENCLKDTLNLTEGPIKISDYGCSEGKNSIIYFSECLKRFRSYSNRTVWITHTDLPSNNWSEVHNLLNSCDFSYLNLPNTYFSTVGRSFFNQIFPSNSIHVGFSAFSFHYLSKKPVRPEGDTSLVHGGFIKQGFEDMKTILKHRIEELVPGGTLTTIVACSGEQLNMVLGKIFIMPFIALLNQGLISEEKIKTMEWNVHGMKIEEMRNVLKEFDDKIDVVHLEVNKRICPFYTEYLETHDLSLYQDKLNNYFSVLSKLQLFSILDDKTEEEKQMIFERFQEETKKVIAADLSEVYMEIITLVIRKK